MAQSKKLCLDEDLMSKNVIDLTGIEEIECLPDSILKDGGVKKKEKCKGNKSKLPKDEVAAKKKKKKQKPQKKTVKKRENETFKGFTQHNEMMSWNGFGLRDEILASLHDNKFFDPTEIQIRCLGPAVYGKRDILGAAETGSGKTLAFGIPIVNGILKLKEKECANDKEASETSDISEDDWEDTNNEIGCVKVKNLRSKDEKNRLLGLILTPTRELAVQVKDHLSEICKYTNIKIVLVVGGLAHEKQERLLNKRPEIIVATPGRLWDLINLRNIHLQDINKVRYLAIDETDRMLEKGHFEELNKLLECMNFNNQEKEKRQNFVFSATLTLVHDTPSYRRGVNRQRITPGQKLQQLIDRIGITNPKIIDVTNSKITPDNLKESKVVCKFEEKDYYLHYFLKENEGKTMIFCNSIGCVKRLSNLLNILDYSPLPLHASMVQKQRLKNLEKFRSKGNRILIATDVAARGLDIAGVDHVLHYQVPKTAEIYVHRSGRTARKRNAGNALLLIEPQEYKSYTKLLHTLGRSHDIADLSIEHETLNQLKKVIHLARDIDQLMLAIKKQNASKNWIFKVQEEMDMIVDEDDLPKQISDEACKKIKTDLNTKKKKLKALLNAPNGQFSKNLRSTQPSCKLNNKQSLNVKTSRLEEKKKIIQYLSGRFKNLTTHTNYNLMLDFSE